MTLALIFAQWAALLPLSSDTALLLFADCFYRWKQQSEELHTVKIDSEQLIVSQEMDVTIWHQ